MSFGVFQFRRGTPALWSSVNPVLADGELGIEKGTSLFKIGNGSTAWNSLPYGGIKGDAGIDASIAVGSVTTGAAGSNASVSNVGTAQNAILNFTIPRGDIGATGNKGWSPVLAIVSDGERRVLQLTDWVGGEGAKPATGQFLGSSGFVATAASAIDIRGPQGQAGITPTQNTFASVSVGTSPTPTILTADNATGVLMVNAGPGISLTADAATDAFTITNTDTGSAAVGAHEGAADPHPQYLTQAEGDARYVQPAQLPPSKLSAKISTLFVSTANSTAVQVVLSLAIPAGYLTAGKSFDIDLEGTQSQSAAATNVVGAIFVNNTQLVSAAVAGGTAAQTNRSLRMKGGVMWNGTGYLGNITVGVSGILPVGNANVAGVTVDAATAHNIDIRVQTSTANAANIIRAMVAAIKEI